MPSLKGFQVAMLRGRILGVAIVFGFVSIAIGCGHESVQGKASLHEMDHEVPSYWPESLSDAAEKMRERILMLGGDSPEVESTKAVLDAKSELLQILAWVPEIAADTDITEAAWEPLAEKSERLHSRLKLEGFDDPFGKKLLDFASELDKAAEVGEISDV